MKREETMSLQAFREELGRYPDHAQVFFGCPDEANPLEFVGVEEKGGDTLMVKFRLNVYKGAD